MKNVLKISRKIATVCQFDTTRLREGLTNTSSNLVEEIDYEFGILRGDDFPSTIIILNSEKFDEIKKMLKDL